MGRVNKKKGNNRAAKMKRRLAKSLDQIREDMHNPKPQLDLELPGLGRFPCVECDRHFINETTLVGHIGTKGHRRRVKLLKEEPFTQQMAERAAGMGSPDNGQGRTKTQ